MNWSRTQALATPRRNKLPGRRERKGIVRNVKTGTQSGIAGGADALTDTRVEKNRLEKRRRSGTPAKTQNLRR